MAKPLEKVTLTPPDLSESSYIGTKAGLRPVRKGGPRFEQEKINNKTIYHNYGFGGAGTSLAPGMGQLAYLRFEKDYPQEKKVAVIGAGYLGLFTALYLLKSKYLVTIYSDNTVQDDPYAQQKDLITSQVAGGFWMPFGYNGDQQQELHEMATRMSHYFYKQSIQNKWYLGVRDMKAYHFDSIDIIKKTIPRGLFQEFQEVEVTFGKKDSDNKDIYHKAWSYPTFMIDSDLFLRELQLELKARGATFVQKRFANKQEVLSLSENYIFNCSGMGSKMLFDDDNFEPVKGQLVAFKKNSPQINYYLSADLNGSRVTLYPHYKTFCVGITYEKNTWDDKPDEKVALQLKTNARELFKLWAPEPKASL